MASKKQRKKARKMTQSPLTTTESPASLNSAVPSVPPAVEHKIDEKQITFCTSPFPGLTNLWRTTLLWRYYDVLGSHNKVHILWRDLTKSNKPIVTSDVQGVYDFSRKSPHKNLYKTVVAVTLNDQKAITITVFFTTGTVLVQGKMCQDWIKSEFVGISTALHTMYLALNQDESFDALSVMMSVPIPSELQPFIPHDNHLRYVGEAGHSPSISTPTNVSPDTAQTPPTNATISTTPVRSSPVLDDHANAATTPDCISLSTPDTLANDASNPSHSPAESNISPATDAQASALEPIEPSLSDSLLAAVELVDFSSALALNDASSTKGPMSPLPGGASAPEGEPTASPPIETESPTHPPAGPLPSDPRLTQQPCTPPATTPSAAPHADHSAVRQGDKHKPSFVKQLLKQVADRVSGRTPKSQEAQPRLHGLSETAAPAQTLLDLGAPVEASTAPPGDHGVPCTTTVATTSPCLPDDEWESIEPDNIPESSAPHVTPVSVTPISEPIPECGDNLVSSAAPANRPEASKTTPPAPYNNVLMNSESKPDTEVLYACFRTLEQNFCDLKSELDTASNDMKAACESHIKAAQHEILRLSDNMKASSEMIRKKDEQLRSWVTTQLETSEKKKMRATETNTKHISYLKSEISKVQSSHSDLIKAVNQLKDSVHNQAAGLSAMTCKLSDYRRTQLDTEKYIQFIDHRLDPCPTGKTESPPVSREGNNAQSIPSVTTDERSHTSHPPPTSGQLSSALGETDQVKQMSTAPTSDGPERASSPPPSTARPTPPPAKKDQANHDRSTPTEGGSTRATYASRVTGQPAPAPAVVGQTPQHTSPLTTAPDVHHPSNQPGPTPSASSQPDQHTGAAPIAETPVPPAAAHSAHSRETHASSPRSEHGDSHEHKARDGQTNNSKPEKSGQRLIKCDVLIVGTSITARINKRMYKHKKVIIHTLDDKTISGATKFFSAHSIDAQVILLQVGSNDVARMGAKNVADHVLALAIHLRETYPQSKVVISGMLPRFSASQPRFPGEWEIYCDMISKSCTVAGFPYICNRNFIQTDFVIDGIHPHSKGVGKLVSNYKSLLNDLLGMKAYSQYQRDSKVIPLMDLKLTPASIPVIGRSVQSARDTTNKPASHAHTQFHRSVQSHYMPDNKQHTEAAPPQSPSVQGNQSYADFAGTYLYPQTHHTLFPHMNQSSHAVDYHHQALPYPSPAPSPHTSVWNSVNPAGDQYFNHAAYMYSRSY